MCLTGISSNDCSWQVDPSKDPSADIAANAQNLRQISKNFLMSIVSKEDAVRTPFRQPIH
jgi:hypothetical protein